MEKKMTNQKLKEARFKKNISQWELSRLTGISQSAISLIENCYIVPKESQKEAISSALDMELSELFQGQDK